MKCKFCENDVEHWQPSCNDCCDPMCDDCQHKKLIHLDKPDDEYSFYMCIECLNKRLLKYNFRLEKT